MLKEFIKTLHIAIPITDALKFTRTGMLLTIISLPINAFLNWIFNYRKFGMPQAGTIQSRHCYSHYPFDHNRYINYNSAEAPGV